MHYFNQPQVFDFPCLTNANKQFNMIKYKLRDVQRQISRDRSYVSVVLVFSPFFRSCNVLNSFFKMSCSKIYI